MVQQKPCIPPKIFTIRFYRKIFANHNVDNWIIFYAKTILKKCRTCLLHFQALLFYCWIVKHHKVIYYCKIQNQTTYFLLLQNGLMWPPQAPKASVRWCIQSCTFNTTSISDALPIRKKRKKEYFEQTIKVCYIFI